MSDSFQPSPLSSINRVDGRLKVTGRADYTADHSLPGQLWAAAVKSTVAKGQLTSLDTTSAEKVPGVRKVYHAGNFPKVYPPKKSGDGVMVNEHLFPLGETMIHYHGQDIAYVVAATYEAAREGAGLVHASYSATAATLTQAQSKAVAPKTVNGEKPHLEKKSGDASVRSAWQNSPVRIDVTYETPTIHHQPMEPHAALAHWEGDRLTVYTPTQWMYGSRNFLARSLAVPDDHVRVISHYLGGAFGCKGASWMYLLTIAAMARDLGQPLKYVMEREDMFTSVGYRPRTIQHLQLGAQVDGHLVALRHYSQCSGSAVGEFVEPTGHGSSQVLYSSPDIEIDQLVFPLDLNAPTFMRAPGESPGVYALESAMDELAEAVKLDPLELRLRNLTAKHPVSGLPFSTYHLAECYREGAQIFGWSGRNPQIGSMRHEDWLVGWGMATATYPAHRSPAKARVRLLADGTAEVQSASQDLGTGTYTVMAQTAAELLGLPVEKVRATLGDSLLPEAPVSGGSQSVASVLPAVRKAALKVLDQVKKLAVDDPHSVLKSQAVDSLEVSSEGLRVQGKPDQHETYATLMGRSGRGAVEATEGEEPSAETRQKKEQPMFSDKTSAFHSFGAYFVEVRVHALTREVRVSRIVTVMDIGQVINLKTARSQILGGAAFGLGAALTEHTILDEQSGRWITHDLGTYHVPVNADYPEIEVKFIGTPDYQFNSLGARGCGEIGNTGITAAIGNAVYHATGIRVRELPITVDKLVAQSPSTA